MILLQYGSDIGTFSPPDVNSHKHIHGKTTIKTTILMKPLTHEHNIHMHYACISGFQNKLLRSSCSNLLISKRLKEVQFIVLYHVKTEHESLLNFHCRMSSIHQQFFDAHCKVWEG